MPLQPDMHLISVDDHLIEHPRVWADRLPAKYLGAAPRIVDVPREKGGPPSQVWEYQGRRYPQIGLNAVAGKDPSEWAIDPARFDEMLPGCYDPKQRLADMDLDGVEAALCFPSFPRFAGTVFLEGDDREVALACVQVYNDFMLDEWCAADPHRYIPLSILPLWDLDACVAEIHRTADNGTRTISFPENTHPLGLPSLHDPHWDPVWRAAAERQLPLSLHFGTSGQSPKPSPDGPLAVSITLFGTNSMSALVDLLFSPVFHKHPDLKIALSEGGIGWIPYILERADYVWERHRFYQNVNQDVRPSELFRRNVYACFIEDKHGLAVRESVGVANMLWECDYPHSDSNWPNSRKVAEEVFADIPDDEVRRIVETNARNLFRFPRGSRMTDPSTEKSLGESDWDDEDLLTISEASERLADEIRLARERGDQAREQELTAAAQRIAAARTSSI